MKNKKIIFYNADNDGCVAKTILAGCYKFGTATLLNWSGATMTCIIEIYEEDNESTTKFNTTHSIVKDENKSIFKLLSQLELDGKKYRIRKLTTRECFRLMGVSDEDIDKIQASSISESSQYKLSGNSIVIDVIYHIFRKMFIETKYDNVHGRQLTLF